MTSAYHCIRCFEQQNKGQSEHESEQENMFETKLPRVGSLNAGSQDPIFESNYYSDSKTLVHFYQLKQCQINNLIRKSDDVNKPFINYMTLQLFLVSNNKNISCIYTGKFRDASER